MPTLSEAPIAVIGLGSSGVPLGINRPVPLHLAKIA